MNDSTRVQDNTASGERLLSLNLLGLSPLLAVSDNLANSLVLGLSTLLIAILASLSCSLLRGVYYPQWRLAVHLLILAFYTSLVVLAIERFWYSFHLQLGIYLPLICCNTALLITLEIRSRHQPPHVALLTGAVTGTLFLGLICVMGTLREWLTVGSLQSLGEFGIFTQASQTGKAAAIIDAKLLALQPGAFILLGLLVAALNAVRRWRQATTKARKVEHGVESVQRVRIVLRP